MSILVTIILITCAALVAAPAAMYKDLMSDKDIKEAEKEFEKLLAA